MLEKQVKKNGVFTNLISLSNLFETEIRKLSKELEIILGKFNDKSE